MDRFETHVHHIWSNTRLLDSINRIEKSVEYAIEIGLKGYCITDHGCVCGWIKANQMQKELDAKGIDFKIGLGEEGYLVDSRESGIKYYHIIWIAKDKIGAKQIRRISSIANLNSYFDRGMERVPITKEEVEMVIGKDKGHIIVTTACLGGELSSSILEMENARKIGDTRTAEVAKQKIINFVLWGKNLFGDDFYFEVAPAANKEQIIVNKKIVELSNVFDVKVILGSDAHYLRKEDRYIHEAYLNSRGGERETSQFYEYAYLQTEEEILENLQPSIVDYYEKLCNNSMEIYNKIEKFSLEHPQQIPHVEVEDFPKTDILFSLKDKYPNLYRMTQSEDKIERYWITKCLSKLKELNKYNDIYLAELEEEADVKTIVGNKLGTNMFSYPVTLSKYIDMFWELGSPVGAGRGSACSALNHYLLGITQLDSIEWNFPFFRYMNRDTDGLGDIDLDLAPSKVPSILKAIKKERGSRFKVDEYNLTPVEIDNLGCVYVCTFGTESTKSAIQTACRGYRSEDFPDGIDVDTAHYLSSLIPSERGFLWPIHDVVYGNEEKGRKPIQLFLSEVEMYPGLLDIIIGVEGMISRKGRHASGVLFLDEDPYEFNAFMKTPSGEVVTQWDLHDAEWAGSTKMDILVTEVQDKIAQTIKFLQKDGEIESDLTLREAYNKYLHPDVLPLDDMSIWKVIDDAAVLDLFQLDSEIGRQGAKKIRPDSMIELSSVNGLIRLMTTEKGAETWLDKYVRFKKDINELNIERDKYNLTAEEREYLDRYLKTTKGIGISQEQMMRVLMDADICNFSLKEANKARKVVSKKKMKEIPILKEKVFSTAKSEALANYVWDYVVGPGLGYAFSDIHSLSYSFIGFQTAYLATKWNSIYWNTSCLVVNSGSLESDGNIEKEKTTDYEKVAKAIGVIQHAGINVSLVNINKSGFGFEPDVKNNRILYGLKALSNINSETIEKIIAGRPYVGIKDFMQRCPLTKTAMINLIKAGAFDEVEDVLADRRQIMGYYISQICEPKKKLTLQNFNGLIKQGIIPKDLELQIRVFNFNKYLKTRKRGLYYLFDDECLKFFGNFFKDNIDDLEIIENIPCIKQKVWDSIYQSQMDFVRDWLKENQQEALTEYNTALFKEMWDKYAGGNISHWEMDSLCFYHGEHELANINNNRYGLVNFNDLSPEPEVDYFFKRNGVQIPIFKLHRIAGTVVAKDDSRTSVTLLTVSGVVTVKFNREYYAMFKKQISQVQPDGSKKVIEKSWFKRGTMLVIQGFRRDDQFVAKNYSHTQGHQLYKITNVVGDEIQLQHERVSPQGSYEEEDYYE